MQSCTFGSLDTFAAAIPLELLASVARRFRQLGIDAQLASETRSLGYSIVLPRGMDMSLIDQLPVIQFVLHDDNRTLVNIAQLHPQDYIGLDSSGVLSVFLEYLEYRPCVLGTPILGKLVLHFDAINSRVGFANPLNDI